MFKKGEYIIYGNTGVCSVTDVTTMNFNGIPKDKPYYVLKPYYEKEGVIYTPVDNNKTLMRKVITSEEAGVLIEELEDIEELWVENDKLREEKYKECIRSCDCREWVRVIKTLYRRKKERTEQGKKITVTDDRYFKIAEECLFSELSVSLGMPKDEVRDFMVEKMKSREAEEVCAVE